MNEDDKKNFLVLMIEMMKSLSNSADKEEALYQLSWLRTQLAFDHALKGFGVDEEEALYLLGNMDESILTQHQIDQKNRLIAALGNLIEFATCEEYQMMNEIPDVNPDINLSTDWWDSTDPDFMEPYFLLNKKYNETYASVEDDDIEYAMAMAAVWITWRKDTQIMYMTQNDERVRPWHYALQGFTAPRDEFPAWMIPPIEWACRCYLVVDDNVKSNGTNLLNIKAKKDITEKPEELSGVFKESVCKCGKIFSDEHPYFDVKEEDLPMLNRIVERIRSKHYG